MNNTLDKAGRFVIYDVLGHKVRFRLPRQKVEGYVGNVLRDIFRNKVILVVDGHWHYFREPSVICRIGNCVVLRYGTGQVEDDRDFFRRMSLKAYDSSLQEVLAESESSCHEVVIEILSDTKEIANVVKKTSRDALSSQKRATKQPRNRRVKE